MLPTKEGGAGIGRIDEAQPIEIAVGGVAPLQDEERRRRTTLFVNGIGRHQSALLEHS
jgi:hypothetical protein